MPVSNIRDSLMPIIWINRIGGLTIFEIPSGNPWIKLSIFYSFIRTVGYAVLFWYDAAYVKGKSVQFPIMLLVYNFVLYVNVFMALVSTVLGFFNYKRIKKFLRKVALIDESLKIFGIDPEYDVTYRNSKKLAIAWYLAIVVIFTSDLIFSIYSFKYVYQAFTRVFTYTIPLVLNPIVELNFAAKVMILRTRFERLNALMRNLTIVPLTTDSQTYNKYRNIGKIRRNRIEVKPGNFYKKRNDVELVIKITRQLHLDLCTSAREANETCSLQVSMQMAVTFFLLTGFTYCLYLIYNEKSIPHREKLQQYVSLITWVAFNIIRMIYVVNTFVNVSAEAHNTSHIAHEIQVSRSQYELTNEIHELSLQILQHPLRFTASGLTTLDFAYVRAITEAVLTYLIILIQNQSDMVKAINNLTNQDSNVTFT